MNQNAIYKVYQVFKLRMSQLIGNNIWISMTKAKQESKVVLIDSKPSNQSKEIILKITYPPQITIELPRIPTCWRSKKKQPTKNNLKIRSHIEINQNLFNKKIKMIVLLKMNKIVQVLHVPQAQLNTKRRGRF